MSPQPPETSKPTKDCRTCNRRRIKCDRALPTCQKCHDRDLFCPGYSVPLRWIQGVASRGKQKGQGPEVARRGSTSTVATSIPASSSTSTSLSLAKSSVAQSPQGIGYSSMILDKPQSPSREVSINYDTGEVASFSTTPTIIPNPLPGSDFFRHPTIRRLMDHFIYVVAPRLAWVDSEDNPWRKIIAPLIQESQSLRCSLLALSAGDFAFKSQHDTKLFTDSLQLSEDFRDKALKLLADQLKAETQGTEETAIVVGHQPQNTDLATTLMLLNLEILQPGNTQWRIHLWAARTMIRRWGDTEHLPIPTDATSNFLVQEFFLINVCAFMTTFTDNHVDYMKEDILNHSGNSFFTDFHRVMHIVTNLERRRVAGNADSTIDEAFVSKRLDQARQSTLKLGHAMNFTPKSIEKEFEHVVDMYHHMGLLYIHRVLFGGSSPNEAMSSSRDQIFRDVLSLGDSKAFVQDLVWPLFIAGTECRGDTNRQNFVDRKLRDVIKATGPLDRWQVLQFLKAFWAEQDCSISWIDFARAWAQEGKTFVVY